MILNESTTDQGLRVGGILKNPSIGDCEILAMNGHNYLLKAKRSGQFVIALGYDLKTKSWAQGKYFGDNEKGARDLWKKEYSRYNAYGTDIGRGLNESRRRSARKMNEGMPDQDRINKTKDPDIKKALILMQDELAEYGGFASGDKALDRKFNTTYDRFNVSGDQKDLEFCLRAFYDVTGSHVFSAALSKVRAGKLNENNGVSSKLPADIDMFLQDVAQITNAISYSDIMKFNPSSSDISAIRKQMKSWKEACEYEDEDLMNKVGKQIKLIIK